MSTGRSGMPRNFKRALLFSGLLHIGLIVLIAASPSFTRTSRRGFVQYVNFIGGGGGGGTPGGPGGGGGGETRVVAETQPPPAPAKKETLRDLTVAKKAPAESASTMRYPVDKPKKTTQKKAAITKAPPSTAAEAPDEKAVATGGQTGGTGYGLRFGTGGGGGGTGTGGGFGSGTGDPYGLAGFPFSYYLQILSDRITANWFTSLVDTGVGGQYQAQVYFRIYKSGQISDLKVDISSGVPAFDLSALRAIQSSAPFPPLPSEYDGQYLGITLIFEHVK